MQKHSGGVHDITIGLYQSQSVYITAIRMFLATITAAWTLDLLDISEGIGRSRNAL